LPLFDHPAARQPVGTAWLLAAALHIGAVILFFTAPLQAPWRRPADVVQQPELAGDTVMFVLGSPELRARGPTIQTTPPPGDSAKRSTEPPGSAGAAAAAAAAARPPVTEPTPTPSIAVVPPPAAPQAAAPAVAAAAAVRDAGVTMPAYDPNASRVAPAPQVGDGRLWVTPRPGLPAAVAQAIYGDTVGRNSAAIARLKAMVDSLNQVLDQIQRENRRPAWVVGGTPDKPAWGLDSQYIHIAGIKIPTVALALLGQFLPQGNYDEGLRARQMEYMRQDLMQAAERAQSFQQFRTYVHELRERKQAERDAEQRRRAQDTATAVP